MKKFLIVLLGLLFVPSVLIILDLLSITKLVPLSKTYDWLSFIGAYVSGIGALFLAYVSIKQNQNLSLINKEMLSNDVITSCFSQIDIEKINYLEINQEIYDSNSVYGLKMVNKQKESSADNYYKIILQIKDNKNLQLVSACIDKLTIEFEYSSDFKGENITNIYESTDSVKLEVTPHMNQITYFLPICIIDDIKYLKAIEESKHLRITAQMSIINSFNVVSKGEYTILLNNTGTVHNNNWKEFYLKARKIYFNEITYKDQ